ncbi:MAG: hypothetical protein ACE5G8_15565, partial [Anaerolineae bacterium]
EEALIPYAPVLGALRAARGYINWQWFPANSPWAGRLRPLLLDPPGEDRSGAASLSPDGLGQFLLALAGRADSVPCLILDDLHHAGETTWQLLAFLGRRCGQAPLLIVAACRPEALSPARRRVLQTLQPRPCAQTITLPPLSPADTARLAALLLPGRRLDKPFLNRLYRATGGNPFFITEYLNAAQSEAPLQPAALQIPPKTVQAAVNLRLNRLPPESKTLLAVAAVVGRTFQFQVLAGAAPSFTENEVLAALETWLQQGLVIERPDGYQFAHEQIQLAAHATLTPAHRREIHAHIAGALTSLPLEPHLKDPARLAFHRQMAQGVTVEELVTPG